MVIERKTGATVPLSSIAVAMYVTGFCQRSSSFYFSSFLFYCCSNTIEIHLFKGISLFKWYRKL